jgi:hypothetical protein
MKRFLKELEFRWEYYIVYFLFHPNKRMVYHTFMRRKWKEKYCTREQWEEYLRSVDPGNPE